MSTTSNKKEQNASHDQQQTSNTSPSNYKWWFISFISIVVLGIVVQQFRTDQKSSPVTSERLFTVEELRTFTKDELYLAILGHVFNVSAAPKFYSTTGAYGHFTGRDASRSFHTGETTAEALTDDLTGLDDEALTGIHHWLTFYQKRYPYVGKLIGRYFTSDGSTTEHFARVLQSVERMKKKDEEKARFEQQWPPCNSEWSQTTGRRVWCSEKSGGIERSWVGVPRRYFDRTARSERCVCVQHADQIDQSQFKEYPQCPSTSSECQIIE